MRKKTVQNILKIILAFLMSFVLLTISVVMVDLHGRSKSGEFSFMRAMQKYADEGEDYFYSDVIGNGRGVAFIGYDCVPINSITKGVKKCKGQYYVFANQTEEGWMVEETKHIIW